MAVYAINVSDLATFQEEFPTLYATMVRPVLLYKYVDCENGRMDGLGVLVKEVSRERWEALYNILRSGMGRLPAQPKHKLRIYESKTGKGGWKRI